MSSLSISVVTGVFFIAMRGWSPSPEWQVQADFAITWILLTYIWVQMGTLILVGAGTKAQMWLDALTSVVRLFVIVYVILQYYSGHLELSSFQIKTAWVTAHTMLLDLVIDLGVSVLLEMHKQDFSSWQSLCLSRRSTAVLNGTGNAASPACS